MRRLLRLCAVVLAAAPLALACGPVELPFAGSGDAPDAVAESRDAGRMPAPTPGPRAHAPADAAPDLPPADEPPFYRFTDDTGSVRFVTSLDQVPAHLRSQATASGRGRLSRIPSTAPRRPTTSLDAPRRANVVVYTAPWCGWCRKTLAWLDARGVSYQNKDIESDDRYRQELLRKTGRTSIPYVEIGDGRIAGFSPGEMTRLLAEQG